MLEKEQVKHLLSIVVLEDVEAAACCIRVLSQSYLVQCLLAGCSYPGREGYSGGGRRCLGGQDVLQLPGQEEPLPHHGVPAWRCALITSHRFV